jgi:hypothetical protein
MPSSKRSNDEEHEEELEELKRESRKGDSDGGAIAGIFVFGAIAGAITLFLVEAFDAAERTRKANAERSK